jgi:hypothetical protein
MAAKPNELRRQEAAASAEHNPLRLAYLVRGKWQRARQGRSSHQIGKADVQGEGAADRSSAAQHSNSSTRDFGGDQGCCSACGYLALRSQSLAGRCADLHGPKCNTPASYLLVAQGVTERLPQAYYSIYAAFLHTAAAPRCGRWPMAVAYMAACGSSHRNGRCHVHEVFLTFMCDFGGVFA